MSMDKTHYTTAWLYLTPKHGRTDRLLYQFTCLIVCHLHNAFPICGEMNGVDHGLGEQALLDQPRISLVRQTDNTKSPGYAAIQDINLFVGTPLVFRPLSQHETPLD
jgi:hypothetical protein